MAKNGSTLSKNTLAMKFMKKTKDKIDRQEYQQEGEDFFQSEETNRLRKHTGNYIIEPSFVFCEGLIEGRLSFHGTNVEIEKIMEIEQARKSEEIEKSKETDVSDETLTKWKIGMKHKMFRANMNANNAAQSLSRDEPDIKKRKFLKPTD